MQRRTSLKHKAAILLLGILLGTSQLFAAVPKTVSAAGINDGLTLSEVCQAVQTGLDTKQVEIELTDEMLKKAVHSSSIKYSHAGSSSAYAKFTNDYFYNQMSSAQKNLYNAIYNEQDSYLTSSIDANPNNGGYYSNPIEYTGYGLSRDEAYQVLLLCMYSNPQFYWWSGLFGTSTTTSASGTTGYLIIGFYDAFANGSARATATSNLMTQVNTYLTQIDAQSSNYLKIKKAHDLLCANVFYTEQKDAQEYPDCPFSQSCYSSFVLGETVCAGYAEAFELLMNAENIPTLAIASNGHEWNQVYFNDYWYVVDVTWDDQAYGIIDNYFLISDTTLASRDQNSNHVPTDEFDGFRPLCPYNYGEEPGTTYTVTFDVNGHGTAPASQSVAVNGTATKPEDLTATGYTFGGWYKEVECTNPWNFSTDVIKTNTTLYAKWTANTYRVTFDANGHGTAPVFQMVAYGDTVTEPFDPIADGYDFGGWYKEAACTNPWNFNADVITSNTTLYAKWAQIVVEEPSQKPDDSQNEPQDALHEEPQNTPEPIVDNTLPSNVTDNGNGTLTVSDEDLGSTTINEAVVSEGMVYRMYNPNSGEHFYTKDASERDSLVGCGWNYEENASFQTIAATEDGAVPVYRVYNPNSGLHHYTTDKPEALMLKEIGWNYEGISLYVYNIDSGKGTEQYRLYCENDGQHHWTVDASERDYLVSLGWSYEGVAWRVK